MHLLCMLRMLRCAHSDLKTLEMMSVASPSCCSLMISGGAMRMMFLQGAGARRGGEVRVWLGRGCRPVGLLAAAAAADMLGVPAPLVHTGQQQRPVPRSAPVGGLGQQALLLQLEADIPGLDARIGIHHDGVQQAAPPHLLDQRAADAAHGVTEERAQARRVFGAPLVLQDLQRGDGDLGGHGVAAVRGPVLPPPNRQHDLCTRMWGGGREMRHGAGCCRAAALPGCARPAATPQGRQHSPRRQPALQTRAACRQTAPCRAQQCRASRRPTRCTGKPGEDGG